MHRKVFILALFFLLPTFAHAQSVDLIWKGETYTPPLYKGLPLWSNQTRISVFAIPNTPGLNPPTLIYRWKKNDTVIESSSGINKRVFSIADSVLSQPINITLDVFVEDGLDPVASASLVLTPTKVRLSVVEDNPLYGLMLNKAIKESYTLTEDEVTLVALPLFSNAIRRNAPALSYSWLTSSGDKRTENSVTYRIPEGGAGLARITLRMNNPQIIAQPDTKNFLIQFDKQNEF
jgi:hypothetical protein